MKVTVLRGISGAGKTTWANSHADQALVVSADHFFVVDGKYQFDPTRLKQNHNKCFRLFIDALSKQTSWIIVDNTNISAWEYSPYVLAGEAFGYEVELVTYVCSVEVSLERKTLVPERDLRLSHARFERETAQMPKRFLPIHRVVDTTQMKKP